MDFSERYLEAVEEAELRGMRELEFNSMVNNADDKHLELILESLAKENKQGCKCCCDSPGNNADEDIHADTVTH